MGSLAENLIQTNRQNMLSKVPQVTIFFWIIKIMATTVGETAADFLNDNLNFGPTNTTIFMSVLLIIALFFQFRTKRYVPSIYWLAVVLISVVGTLGSDNLADNLGVPLNITTAIFFVLMAVSFLAWYLSERTLSIHSIYTAKREAFYWLAILFTFALGTAAGDWISEGLNLGYLNSALMFAAVIGIVTIAHYLFKMNSVLAFWIAYILTRPFGASVGDYLSQSNHNGGLGLGTTGTSIVFLVVILCLVTYLTKTRRDQSPLAN
ncbi:hypothetical protein ACIFOT_08140 [Neobacillus sp. NRS-1170]|uniref:COG4705 family protein n=1 Tax=Neobacillus sp. NRS-1170 TaxID=3233898 RepID=UPI003D26E9A5